MSNSKLPLANQTVIVTRSASQSGKFCQRLQQAGARVIEMPALEIGPPSSWEALDASIVSLESFDWLILTSTNGVDYFFERLKILGRNQQSLGCLKIAVVGEKTAACLKEKGIEPAFVPPNFVADSLVETFPENLTGKKILFPRVETGGREVLVKEFTLKGANVVEVPAYESRCPISIMPVAWEALQQHQVNFITFASSKTVKNFCRLVEQADAHKQGLNALLFGIYLASIGPQTSKTCQELFGRVDIEAEEYTLEGLFKALIRKHLERRDE